MARRRGWLGQYVTMRMSRRQVELLDDHAARLQLSRSAAIRELVMRGLASAEASRETRLQLGLKV